MKDEDEIRKEIARIAKEIKNIKGKKYKDKFDNHCAIEAVKALSTRRYALVWVIT